jgi:hypothetical protein
VRRRTEREFISDLLLYWSDLPISAAIHAGMRGRFVQEIYI